MPQKTYNPIYRALAKFAFELTTIIAGILIALFVNNIQEHRKDREILNSTLNSLSKEFNRNVENIQRIQPRLERIRDTLDFYAANNEFSIYDLALKAPGLTAVDLFTTNWQATLSSNSLRLLSFDVVTQLSRIDAKHQELRDQAKILNELIYNANIYKRGTEGSQHRMVLSEWLGSYMGNERELIVLYDEFKELIKPLKTVN